MFGGMFSAITAPVVTGARPSSGSKPTTATAKALPGAGQPFHRQPTFGECSAYATQMPEKGSKAYRILFEEEVSEGDTDAEDLGYFTAAARPGEVEEPSSDSGSSDEDEAPGGLGEAANADAMSASSGVASGSPTASPTSPDGSPRTQASASPAGGPSSNAAAVVRPLRPVVRAAPTRAVVRSRRKQQIKAPIASLPKLKIQLPSKEREAVFREYNVGANVDSRPRMALFKTYLYVVDEVHIFVFSTKTGQQLVKWRHNILDADLEAGSNAQEQNPDDDNGLLPNIVTVQIFNVGLKARLALLIATNHVVKLYWVPGP
ncbi:unnamed protein product [Amoebophrya sp. A25]|nr:unnamed protein product [Amoebophrya sp. A25]|eukprot:GSA25T00026901001.1